MSEPMVFLASGMPDDVADNVSNVLEGMGIAAVRQVALAPPTLAPPILAPPAGKVIVVLSPKGGSGKTAIASNLSIALAQQHPGRVAVVDLDVQFGDLGVALGLTPEHNLAQLARSSVIDATTVKVFLTPYDDLYVLCGAPNPEEADVVTDRHVATVLPLLAQSFDYVVVDTPAGLDDRTLAALECATDLLLVSSLDVTSIRSLRKAIDTLDKIGVQLDRRFVLNRSDAKVGLNKSDAESAMGMKVSCSIPSSRSIPLSLNLGKPVVKSEPKSPLAKQFAVLAHQFSPVEPDAPRKGWRR